MDWRGAPRLLARVLMCLLAPGAAFADVHHDLRVVLDPDGHRIEVVDRITLPEAHDGPVHFQLHEGLNPRLVEPDAALERTRGARLHRSEAPPVARRGVGVEDFDVRLRAGTRRFTLAYGGAIFHPVEQLGEEYARSFSISPGLVAPEGVFLAGSSYWYPYFPDQLVTFTLDVDLPPGWSSVSQGARTAHAPRAGGVRDAWTIDRPQDEIYLVAAPFHEYEQAAGAVQAMVFLRRPDPALAQKYLDATAQYLAMYDGLIGPYPYRKFALVENFWETGYGMPSFTLLGPKVIRFPFILHSSYPHEILHNWWGNGVYVDYARGNWAEGLTSYLADHLIKEQHGQGVAYRREVLQKYTDYVRAQKDFPLTEFRSRHSSVTEAVGYGKTLMLFHMLRQELGDEGFTEGLRRFYRRYLFKVAGFAQVESVFSEVAGRSLEGFFGQWVRRTGAPSLRVAEAAAEPEGGGFRLSALIEQVQDGPPYRLSVPVAVALEGAEDAYQIRIVVDGKRQRLSLHLPARPVRLDIDPEFDLFRRLDRREIPPTVSQALGAERALIVLPSSAPEGMRKGYEALARAWQAGRSAQVEVRLDSELAHLPAHRAVWLFGWENRFRPLLAAALAGYAFADEGDALRIDGTRLARKGHAAVVIARRPTDPDQALAWIGADDPAALPGLGRKLPHYGKYSYLGFSGEEPVNVAKGQWPVVGSPLSVTVAQADGKAVAPGPARLKPRHALAQLPSLFSKTRMLEDIGVLAADDMAGRGLGSPELDRAAEYIAAQFRAAGLLPGGDGPGSYIQAWNAAPDGPGRGAALKNVVGVIPGTDPRWAGQSVVVGAHYDHLGRGWPDVHRGDEGKVHPGADDNASGVAVLLELARVLGKHWRPERSVVFVAFSGEEEGRLGSIHYVNNAGAFPVERSMGMINLDTVGRLGDRPLLILGSGSAREWVHIFRGAGFVTGAAVKPVAEDFGSSDQKSFLDAGVPAVQFFSGPHGDYHRPTDTVDKIDGAGLVKTARVLKEAVEYLASRPEPLTSTLTAGVGMQPAPAPGGRRVSLGTVPDFAYTGKGVRIAGVNPGTPAREAGLQAGDIIVQVNDKAVGGLRDFSDVLRGLQPGDAVSLRILRDGRERAVSARVVAR